MNATRLKILIQVRWPTYKLYNDFWTSLSACLAVFSIVLGFLSNWFTPLRFWIGPLIVGLWIVFPPLYLWIDWAVYAEETKTHPGHDYVKHNHDLARNIWVGLVVLLSGLYKVTLFK